MVRSVPPFAIGLMAAALLAACSPAPQEAGSNSNTSSSQTPAAATATPTPPAPAADPSPAPTPAVPATPTAAAAPTPAAETPASATATAQVQRAALAQGLYEVAYSPRAQAVFVTTTGGRGENATTPRVLRLNPATLAIEAEITLPQRGFGLTLDDANQRLYVGNGMDGAVTQIDTSTNRVLGQIRLAEAITDAEGKTSYPHHFRQLVLDPANASLYLPGMGMDGSALYVVDLATQERLAVVPDLGFVATGIALNAPQNKLYVSNLQGQIKVIDTDTLTVSQTLETSGDQLLNLAFDPATQRLFATDQGLSAIDGMRSAKLPNYTPRGKGNQVLVIDARDGSTLHAIPTGDGPIAVVFDPEHQRLYVTNRGAGTVTVYDSNSYALLDTVALPTHPNSMAFDPAGNVLYVSIKNGEADPKGSDESLARVAF